VLRSERAPDSIDPQQTHLPAAHVKEPAAGSTGGALTDKSRIVRQLGEGAVLLPTLLAEAFAANDRLKLRLTMLQEASTHSQNPSRPVPSLSVERRIAGLTDPQFDALIAGARALPNNRVQMPGGQALLVGLSRDLEVMLAPLEAAKFAALPHLKHRLTALTEFLPTAHHDELSLTEIIAMTTANRDGPDSVHLLVMDAHRALNALAAETAPEVIDGAHVHHIADVDRSRIKAFMAGLNRTAALAFGHPGLRTTAVRSDNRLTIQNDIGETDAHVLIIHVQDLGVSVTYTDVHRRRTRFFMSLFESQELTWNSPEERHFRGPGQDGVFHLVVGNRVCVDEETLLRFLDFLGSRIVFLIDWNKARKALQTFVGKEQACEILRWAADRDFGHRAFLELGGADLVFEAIRRTAVDRIPYGTRLDAAVGMNECAKFLQRVLRQTSEGLKGRRSLRLIRDEIQAELAQLFDTAEFAVLALLVRHLGIARTLASAIAENFACESGHTEKRRLRLAERAKQIEEKADRITVQARETCARMQDAESLRRLVDEIENATDALDECAFLWSIQPAAHAGPAAAALYELADVVLDSIGQLIRATEAASHLPEGGRTDATASLQAIDAVTLAERRADTAERAALHALMRGPSPDSRSLMISLELVRMLETTTDHLAHAALSLRERVLEELSL
jgi:uncharacterized protein Yka (UPF0111/DUF47 family)